MPTTMSPVVVSVPPVPDLRSHATAVESSTAQASASRPTSREKAPSLIGCILTYQHAGLEERNVRGEGGSACQRSLGAQRRVLAECLSGKKLSDGPLNPTSVGVLPGWRAIGSPDFRPARLQRLGRDPDQQSVSGGSGCGTHEGGYSAAQIEMAFGFPGATSGATQPVVYEGRLYVGTAEGDVWALAAQTGCTYWRLETEAAVQWKVKVDDHARAAVTGCLNCTRDACTCQYPRGRNRRWATRATHAANSVGVWWPWTLPVASRFGRRTPSRTRRCRR